MEPTIEWFQRKFRFDSPIRMFPNVVKRLRGTPARVEEQLRGLVPEMLTRGDEVAGSIQENVGHLLDLEPLFAGRLDDSMAGLAELTAADLGNRENGVRTDAQKRGI